MFPLLSVSFLKDLDFWLSVMTAIFRATLLPVGLTAAETITCKKNPQEGILLVLKAITTTQTLVLLNAAKRQEDTDLVEG